MNGQEQLPAYSISPEERRVLVEEFLKAAKSKPRYEDKMGVGGYNLWTGKLWNQLRGRPDPQADMMEFYRDYINQNYPGLAAGIGGVNWETFRDPTQLGGNAPAPSFRAKNATLVRPDIKLSDIWPTLVHEGKHGMDYMNNVPRDENAAYRMMKLFQSDIELPPEQPLDIGTLRARKYLGKR